MTEGNNHCEQVFPYFLKELSSDEAEAFERHLSSCADCRDELIELQQVWHTLPFEMDEVEVPETAKAAMLSNIIQEIEGEPSLKEQAEPTGQSHEPELAVKPIARHRNWTYAAAAIVCIMVGAAAGWGLNEYRLNDSDSSRHLAAPAQVIENYALKAFDPAMPSASGNCWIKQQGQQRQLIVQVNGLKENAGEQAYQVWFVKQGTRFNGGTFRVDDKGNGILTYELKPSENDFDTIGITLEPDALGTKPRGKKVLGT